MPTSYDPPAPSVGPSAAVERLDTKHATWKTNHEVWELLDLLYRSGRAIQEQASRFLRRRPKEPTEVYTMRLAAFDHTPVMGTALGWYQAKLFATDPAIDIRNAGESDPSKLDPKQKDAYTKFLQNCDRSGTTFVDIWRAVFQHLLVFRSAYILIDLPQVGDISNRAAERAAGGMDPYLVVYDPRSVINWDVDQFGNLAWAVIKVNTFRQNFLGDGLDVDRWYYYDKQEYRIYERTKVQKADTAQNILFGPAGELIGSQFEQTAKMVARGPHAMAEFDRVPLRHITVPEGLWLANRAYLPSITHLNLENSYIWALFMANLPIAIVKSESEFNQTISETSVIELGPEDSFEYTEPKGTSFAHSDLFLRTKREEIFRSVFLTSQGRDSSASASASSGLSKQMDLLPAKDVLSSFGDTTRAEMQNTLGDVALVRGDAVEFDVRGFDFEESSALEEAEILELLMSLDIPSDELYKQAQIRVSNAYLRDANREVVQTVADEIRKAPSRSEQQAQQLQQQKLAMAQSLERSTGALTKNALSLDQKA